MKHKARKTLTQSSTHMHIWLAPTQHLLFLILVNQSSLNVFLFSLLFCSIISRLQRPPGDVRPSDPQSSQSGPPLPQRDGWTDSPVAQWSHLCLASHLYRCSLWRVAPQASTGYTFANIQTTKFTLENEWMDWHILHSLRWHCLPRWERSHWTQPQVQHGSFLAACHQCWDVCACPRKPGILIWGPVAGWEAENV